MLAPPCEERAQVKQNNMKKVYVKPSVEVIKVNAVNMLANSLPINGAKSVDTTVEGEQLGRKASGSSFGNIWDSQW